MTGQGTHVYVVGINVVGIGVSQHRVEFHSVPIVCKYTADGQSYTREPRAGAGSKGQGEAQAGQPGNPEAQGQLVHSGHHGRQTKTGVRV
jgi:hypothetical protein